MMSLIDDKSLIEDRDGNVFQLVNVPGDGKCLFHSFVRSSYININDPDDFRRDFIKAVQK